MLDRSACQLVQQRADDGSIFDGVAVRRHDFPGNARDTHAADGQVVGSHERLQHENRVVLLRKQRSHHLRLAVVHA